MRPVYVLATIVTLVLILGFVVTGLAISGQDISQLVGVLAALVPSTIIALLALLHSEGTREQLGDTKDTVDKLKRQGVDELIDDLHRRSKE